MPASFSEHLETLAGAVRRLGPHRLLLVIVVVYVFLQNWRATIIQVVAIPILLVGTFTILAAFGASINLW